MEDRVFAPLTDRGVAPVPFVGKIPLLNGFQRRDHLGVQSRLRRYLVGGDHAGLDCVQAGDEPHPQLPRWTPIVETLKGFRVVDVRDDGVNVVIPDWVPVAGPCDLGLNAVRVDPTVAGRVPFRLAIADANQFVGIFWECVGVVKSPLLGAH